VCAHTSHYSKESIFALHNGHLRHATKQKERREKEEEKKKISEAVFM